MEKDRTQDPDGFWDLSRDLSKKESPKPSRPDPSPVLADIRLEPDAGSSAARSVTVEPLPLPKPPPMQPALSRPQDPEPVRVSDLPLILSVQVFRPNQKYHFYDDFRQQALRYRDWHAREGVRTPYFSFLPQYMQLSSSQRDWYFFWRDEFRAGKDPDTDYSYLLLFGYELINLLDVQDPGRTLEELCRLWTAYRGRYPRLDAFLPDWIMDLCLITGLPVPEACRIILEEPGLFEKPEIPEFFITSSTKPLAAVRMLQGFSKYDYKKGIYYRKSDERNDYASFYDRYFLPACASGVPALFRLLRERAVPTVLERDAFPGAICSSAVKRRLKISYVSLRTLTTLRDMITLMFRHTENGIRALLNLPSRLASGKLDPSVARDLDRYFAELSKHLSGSVERSRLKRSDDRSGDGVDYAGKYDLPYAPLSADNARRIESESWKTTEKLVETLDGEEPKPESGTPAEAPLPDPAAVPEPDASASLHDTLVRAGLYALCAALCEGGSARFRAACERAGVLPESAVGDANELALSVIGDIIIENEAPGSFAVVPDYLDEWYLPGA